MWSLVLGSQVGSTVAVAVGGIGVAVGSGIGVADGSGIFVGSTVGKTWTSDGTEVAVIANRGVDVAGSEPVQADANTITASAKNPMVERTTRENTRSISLSFPTPSNRQHYGDIAP